MEETESISTKITDSFRGAIELSNGDRLNGMVYLYSDGSVMVKLDTMGEVQLSKEAVKRGNPTKGAFSVEDRGMPRYFYAPTAMPLEPESGYLSQKKIAF